MKLQLATKQQTEKLIKLGFDIYSENFFPETALAIKWLREVKGLDVSIGLAFSPNWDKQYYPVVALNDLNYHDTYDEAEAAGLDYALDLLLRS